MVIECKHATAIGPHLIRCRLLAEQHGIEQVRPFPHSSSPCSICVPNTDTLLPIVRKHLHRFVVPDDVSGIEGGESATRVRLPSRGLGDTIAKALHAIGVEQRPGCGCAERADSLNRLVPYRT